MPESMPLIFSWAFLNSSTFQSLVILVTATFAFILYRLRKTEEIRNAAKIILIQIESIEENISTIQSRVKTASIDEADIFESKQILNKNSFEEHGHKFMDYIEASDYKIIKKFYDSAERIEKLQSGIKSFSSMTLEEKSKNYVACAYKIFLLSYQQMQSQKVQKQETQSEQAQNQQEQKQHEEKQETQSQYCCSEVLSNLMYEKTIIDHMNRAITTAFFITDKGKVNTYLPAHYGVYLENYLREYAPIVGSTAYNALQKISRRNFIWY